MSDTNVGGGILGSGTAADTGANILGIDLGGGVTAGSSGVGVTVGLGLSLGGLDILGGVGLSLGGSGAGASSGAGTAAGTGAGVGVGVDVGLGATGSGSGTGVDVGLNVGLDGSGDGSGGSGSGVGVGVGVGVGLGGSGTDTGAGGTGAGGTGTAPGTGAGGAGGTGTGATGPAAGLPDPETAFLNIFRLGSAADIPSTVQTQLVAMDQQVAAGALTPQQAILKIVDAAAGFTAVAETTYNFFTGLTPTAEGLDYLVHSTTNATDLSDSYYSGFDLENRYINFASNLGLHSDYAPEFASVFGPMTFQQAVATAYDRIVGDAEATAAGVDPQAAIADIVARQPYFQEVAQERFAGDNQDLASKLAAVAYIMEESVRADVGRYGTADQNFLYDLADGHAQFHVDLVGVYGHGAPTNLTS